jgi:hypothetical protein
MIDSLDIPEFLRRPFDIEAWRRSRTRTAQRARTIPWKGYKPGKRRHDLPRNMDATAWALLRQQEADAAAKTKARLAALRERART